MKLFSNSTSPPRAEDAAKRALILFLVYQRGEIEDAEPEASERTRNMMVAWLRDVGLWGTLSNIERCTLTTRVGSLEQQLRVNASWRLESLGTIAWALRRVFALPPYDTQFNEDALTFLPVPGSKEDVSRFIAGATLREQPDISHSRDIAQTWHWRYNTTRSQQMGVVPPGGLTFEKIIEMTASSGHEGGEIPSPIDGDFPVLGKSYAQVTEDEFLLLGSIARERQYALNWLCGYSKDWDKVPTDT